jgi:putative transposase
MNQQQQFGIDYLRKENRVLKEQLGCRQLRLNDDQQRRLGIAATANGLWMSQIGRNLTDPVDGILKGKRYLIHDRDPPFTAEFLATVSSVGVKSVELPPYSPNLNAPAGRFVRTIKQSCVERMIWFGEGALCKGVQEFVAYYHRERNHQGLQPADHPG